MFKKLVSFFSPEPQKTIDPESLRDSVLQAIRFADSELLTSLLYRIHSFL